MVVSSMIQDHGLQVEKYLMCNSAVPAEAYDPDPSLRVPQLVHPDWEEYPTNTWTASCHSLFDGFPDDDRRHLGWPGRFADVAQYAVNFYSTGDEVLEISADNDLNVLSGVTMSLGQYSWHKQELFKGRGILDGLGGTDWSGWRFNGRWRSLHPAGREWEARYTAEQASVFSPEQLRTEPVFYPYPESMTNAVIPLLVRAAHLTKGVPALTPATGRASLDDALGDGKFFRFPATNIWFRFDMRVGDFVKPFGKGETADFECQVEWDGLPPTKSTCCKMSLRMLDRLAGGYYAYCTKESEYPFSYAANVDAELIKELNVVNRDGNPHTTKVPFREGCEFVTRTRCKVDNDGRLVAANYGSIRALSVSPSWDGNPTLRLYSVINQTPNDTNLEDDERYQRYKRLRDR